MWFKGNLPLSKLGALSLVTAVGLATGCSDTEFQGSNKKTPAKKQEVIPVEKTLNLTCEDGEPETELVTDINGSSKTSVTLKGEFCNVVDETSSGDLNVLFLLDFSGSMGTNDPLDIGTDRCGRLEAAEAISNKLKDTIPEGVDVKAGILSFGTNALPETPFTALDAFSTNLNSTSFCGNAGGDTNYDAAFTKAKELLQDLPGKSVIYFISDGVPSVSGTGLLGSTLGVDTDPTRAEEKGIESAEALREAMGDKLDLNAIFLGVKPLNVPGIGGTIGQDLDSFDPQKYLEKVTGDAEKVRLVTGADSLADEIVSFETPDVLTLDSSSIAGFHSASAYGKQKVEVAFMEKDPNREGVWIFETKPFDLFGESGEIVENEIVFTAEASNGETHRARVLIKFEIDSDGNIRKL